MLVVGIIVGIVAVILIAFGVREMWKRTGNEVEMIVDESEFHGLKEKYGFSPCSAIEDSYYTLPCDYVDCPLDATVQKVENNEQEISKSVE